MASVKIRQEAITTNESYLYAWKICSLPQLYQIGRPPLVSGRRMMTTICCLTFPIEKQSMCRAVRGHHWSWGAELKSTLPLQPRLKMFFFFIVAPKWGVKQDFNKSTWQSAKKCLKQHTYVGLASSLPRQLTHVSLGSTLAWHTHIYIYKLLILILHNLLYHWN